MQTKSESFSEFSVRTEAISLKTGLKLSDLPDYIGVSDSMFFAYRSGKQPISAKAWRKLAAAEVEAGLVEPTGSDSDEARNSREDLKTSPLDAVESQPGNRSIPAQTSPMEIHLVMRRLAKIYEDLALIQAQLAAAMLPRPEPSVANIIASMNSAGAWPPSEEDGKLTVRQLLEKYGVHVAASLNTSIPHLDLIDQSNVHFWPTDQQAAEVTDP